LGPDDAAAYRALRLEGLRRHPEAFGASWEDEAGRPLDWFSDRLAQNATFGGFADATLLGAAGLRVPEAAKARHKGVLWGMYVRPEARGTGLAASLVAAVIGHARGVVEEVRLSVTATNLTAVGLYARAGFVEYGLERRALKVDSRYHDELLMSLVLDRPAG